MSRLLLITRRRIPLDRLDHYDAGWHRLRAAAHGNRTRAWRFRAAGKDDVFLEFLEWDDAVSAAPDADPTLVAVRAELEQAFGADRPERWEEVADAPPASERAALRDLIRARSVRRGDFVLASGARSSYYIDARITTMSGDGQRRIGRVALDTLARLDWSPRAVGGLTLGADPIAYAIAHAASLRGIAIDAFTIRKQAKQHGTGRRIEGAFPEEGSVVIIEDVITTGESALQAVSVVREAGNPILGVLALVDRMEGGVANLQAAGLDVHALFTAEELLSDDDAV